MPLPRNESRIEDRISEFVAQAYFKAGYPTEIDPAHIYTYIVDYWGKGILPRSRGAGRKAVYLQKMADTRVRKVRGTLRVSQMPKNPEFYLIEFRYLFDVSGPKGYRSGEALARLIVIEGAAATAFSFTPRMVRSASGFRS